jgi:branched-chain amino acid transport system substrate-binding protein
LSRIAVVVTAGALALTGCSSSGGKDTSSGGGLGGGTSTGATGTGGGAAGGSYKIGFQGALSGDNKQLGINEINAVNLAVKQANADSSLGFKLSVVTADDGGVPDKSPAAAAKLIQDQAIIGIVGPIFSGPTSAVGKTYAQAGIALISPSATNETLTSSGFTTFHRIVPTDGVEGKATADYLAKKYKKVFVVDDASTYGKGVGDVVRAELKAKGVKVDNQSIAPTSDYSGVAQQVKSSGDEAMYYGGYDAQAGLLAKALKAVNYKGFRIGGNGGKSTVFTSTAGAAGDGFYFACGCLDATTAPQAKAFSDAYQAAYNTPSSTYSPEAYDATNALIQAIKAAKASGSVTRASVEKAVNALNYKGITTTVKFASNGEVAQATVNLYEQKAGKIVLLGDITQQ